MRDHLLRKILVVDDDESVLSFMRLVLQKMDYETHEARDGEEALSVCEDVKPEAVFTDVIMPRLGGIEFLRRLREKDMLVFAVMMTGFSTEETAVQAAQLGVTDYLLKPFGRDRVVMAVERLEKLAWMRSGAGREERDSPIVADNVEARLTNDLPAAQRALNRLFNLMSIDDGDMMVGMLEIVINAIEHGNLEISFDAKTGLPDVTDYIKFLRDRAAAPPYKDRVVRLTMRRIGGDVECVVQDEGPGFDWMGALTRNGGDELLHHGRGLELAQTLFDDMEYNGAGNRVRVLKKNVRFKNSAPTGYQ